jgi:hypothetical protein
MEPAAAGDTPPSPAAYVAIGMPTSLVLAAGAVAAVYLVGAVTSKVSMPAGLWVIAGCCVWAGSLLFAAFGLSAGYPLPSENVTQVISLGLAVQLAGSLPDRLVIVDGGNYVPALRDGPIEAGQPESVWVQAQPRNPVMKAFDTIRPGNLATLGRPSGTVGRTAIPVAGDDPAAKAAALALVDQLGPTRLTRETSPGPGAAPAGRSTRRTSFSETPATP